MTFVRTKLLIEKMAPGQIAEIRLQGSEPLENVPRSVQGQGDTVISLRAEDPEQEPHGIHRLLIQKG